MPDTLTSPLTRVAIYPDAALPIADLLHLERYIPQKERDSYDEADFAGPDRTFPITTQAQLDAAAHLIGHAADPEAVKRKAIAIAKRKGFSLPKAWQDEDKDSNKERSMNAPLQRAAATHEPMSGTHSHSHPAFGSQGEDDSHEHEHSHDNDADHHHSHAELSPERALSGAVTPESLNVYLPITRFDATSREVFGQATVEKPDSYGTIFGYYPEAWQTWRGNMREQHDPKKAVGRAVEVTPDPDERAIFVTSKVSRGAQDTWLKIEDGVLSGYSASVIPDPEFGSDPKRWPRKEYQGKSYPYLPRYTVAELSYVDNPATPGCNITLVRADGVLTEVIDTSEDTPSVPESVVPPSSLERAGARLSADTRASMHKGIGHTLHAAVSQMQNCGCEGCQAAMSMLDPDNDGDIDFGGYDDPDGDSAALMDRAASGEMTRSLETTIERILEQKLSAVYARLQGIAGTLARAQSGSLQTASLEPLITGAIDRALVSGLSATRTSLDEVRTELSVVKGQVERIAETPVPGAPVMNLSAANPPRAVEKRTALDPYARPQTSGSSVADAMAEMQKRGQLDNYSDQIEAFGAALIAQRRGGR